MYKLDQKKFSFEKDLYICPCYIPPVNSVYYDDNFSKLEDENSKVMSNSTCNILIAGDLNARILNHIDFIVNESIKKCNSHETLEYLLPDNYNTDYNINRCSVDKILNAQGQQLIDLCIASQVRVLNGRFVGDSCR